MACAAKPSFERESWIRFAEMTPESTGLEQQGQNGIKYFHPGPSFLDDFSIRL
jgi:hypothetical protein